jgi:hypothetical protein
MPALVETTFTDSGLSKSTANALHKKAERRGMTVDAYVKRVNRRGCRVGSGRQDEELCGVGDAVPERAGWLIGKRPRGAGTSAAREAEAVTRAGAPVRVQYIVAHVGLAAPR